MTDQQSNESQNNIEAAEQKEAVVTTVTPEKTENTELPVPDEHNTLAVKIGRLGVILFSTAFIILCMSGKLGSEIDFSWSTCATFIIVSFLLAFRSYERFYLKLGQTLKLADCELCMLSLAFVQLIVVLTTNYLGSLTFFFPLLALITIGAFVENGPLIVILALYTLATAVYLGLSWQSLSIAFSSFLLLAPVVSASLGRILFYALLNVQKMAFKKHLDDYDKKLHEQAKKYRLLPESNSHQALHEENSQQQLKLLTASVEAVNDGIKNLIDIYWSAIQNEAASLLYFELENNQLTLRQSRNLAEIKLTKKYFNVDEGIFSLIMRKSEPLKLEPPNGRLPPLHYLPSNSGYTGLLALPLVIKKERLGLILVHFSNTAISQKITDVSNCFLTELARLVEFEGQFNDIYKQKIMYMVLSEAASNFNTAMGLQAVANVALAAARDISAAEFAAMTIRTTDADHNNCDVIIGCSSKYSQHSAFIGKKLYPDAGICASVMKHHIPLPEQPVLGPRQVIFDNMLQIREIRAARIYPLMRGQEAIGTLIVGSSDTKFLSTQAKDMLGVIAEQAATSVSNAQLFEKTEQMACTDGLTGLLNHRNFQDQFTKVLERARRNQRAFCLLIADIDHFKRINDTYGHPMGDQVLRKVAESLQSTARRTDIVARYGGEEFAIIMEDTDWIGALRIAERIRENVSKLVFQAATGPFHCYLSMGISSYPLHEKERQKIINAADNALYQAKEGGRNRVIVYGQNTAEK